MRHGTKALLSWIFLVASLGAVSPSDVHLQMRSGGRFKIVQFTDVHFDSTGDACGNVTSCIQATQQLMRHVLEAEAPVDLVAMTGDTACDTKECYDASVAPMQQAGVPWAFINGNHDTQARAWQLGYDMSLNGSLTGSFNGINSTYKLDVLNNHSNNVTAATLWFFDSGDVDCLGVPGYACVDEPQIEWYRQQSDLQLARNSRY